MKDKSMKKKVNIHVNGARERVYVYFAKSDKEWLKEQANKKGISVSKFIHDLVKTEMLKDLRLELNFEE